MEFKKVSRSRRWNIRTEAHCACVEWMLFGLFASILHQAEVPVRPNSTLALSAPTEGWPAAAFLSCTAAVRYRENVAKVRFDGRWAEVNKGSESTRIHTHTTQLLRYFLCKQPRRGADSTRVFLAHYRRWGGELVSLFSISPPAHSLVPFVAALPVIFRAVCTSIRGAARDRRGRKPERERERKRRANFANELDSCCIFHLLPADAALWDPKTN
jgi:hypothetical protein